jgi:hypothetical protein
MNYINWLVVVITLLVSMTAFITSLRFNKIHF